MSDVAGGTQKTGAAAEAVKTTARDVGAEADRLRSQVNDFLAKMRAA